MTVLCLTINLVKVPIGQIWNLLVLCMVNPTFESVSRCLGEAHCVRNSYNTLLVSTPYSGFASHWSAVHWKCTSANLFDSVYSLTNTYGHKKLFFSITIWVNHVMTAYLVVSEVYLRMFFIWDGGSLDGLEQSLKVLWKCVLLTKKVLKLVSYCKV